MAKACENGLERCAGDAREERILRIHRNVPIGVMHKHSGRVRTVHMDAIHIHRLPCHRQQRLQKHGVNSHHAIDRLILKCQPALSGSLCGTRELRCHHGRARIKRSTTHIKGSRFFICGSKPSASILTGILQRSKVTIKSNLAVRHRHGAPGSGEATGRTSLHVVESHHQVGLGLPISTQHHRKLGQHIVCLIQQVARLGKHGLSALKHVIDLLNMERLQRLNLMDGIRERNLDRKYRIDDLLQDGDIHLAAVLHQRLDGHAIKVIGEGQQAVVHKVVGNAH